RRTPRRAGGVRPDRRAPPGDPSARDLGRRRTCRRQRAGGPEAPPARAAGEAPRLSYTARGAARLGVRQVNGFSGSAIWHLLYSFPPNDFAEIERGYQDFAKRWGPIIEVFDQEGVRFGLEVHPTEIAYDFVTTRKALEAINR